MGFLLLGLFIVAGLTGRSPIAAISGLVVLGLSTSLTAILLIGQRKLKHLFQALSGWTGLTCRQFPDVIPGLYHLSLAGEVRGRYVEVNFENHEEGIEKYWQGKMEHHRKRIRKYLVVRARCNHPGAKGRFKPLKLTAAYDAGEVAALLTPTLLYWLTEAHRRDEMMVGAGAIGFRRDAQMTREGFEHIRADIFLAVELAEQLER